MTALQGRVRHRPARLIGPHAPCPKKRWLRYSPAPLPRKQSGPGTRDRGIGTTENSSERRSERPGRDNREAFPACQWSTCQQPALRGAVLEPLKAILYLPPSPSRKYLASISGSVRLSARSPAQRDLFLFSWPVAHPDFRNRSSRKVSPMIEQLHQADCQSKYSYAGGFASIALPLTSWLISLTKSNHSNPNQLTGPAPFSPWACPSRSRKELAERESPVHP